MTAELELERIARSRACIPPYPCGLGAGGHGNDLPCDCAQLADAALELATAERRRQTAEQLLAGAQLTESIARNRLERLELELAR